MAAHALEGLSARELQLVDDMCRAALEATKAVADRAGLSGERAYRLIVRARILDAATAVATCRSLGVAAPSEDELCAWLRHILAMLAPSAAQGATLQ